jgi:Family of unknown function (DUF6311)
LTGFASDTESAAPTSQPDRGMLTYLVAALIGGGLALWIFPLDFLLPRAGVPWWPLGDAAQHSVAQRYFLHDAWRWPPVIAMNLDTPDGVNVAFSDGIPLLALPLKLLANWLPAGFHGVGLWHFAAWLLQPVAAVWCLRGTGETRFLPALGVGLAALGMPAWLARYGHAALSGQFLLLVALGLYLRLLRTPGRRLWLVAAAVEAAMLLAHPYLATMGLALLGAVPLTLLLRRASGWSGALLGFAGCGAGLVAASAALGYLGASGEGGYGRYAMNLLSPVWPYGSTLFGRLAPHHVDATGEGGWEGYNWLGSGLLLGLVLAVVLRGRALATVAHSHSGLVLVLVGLGMLALSHRVGVGSVLLVDAALPPGPPSDLLEQFRSSGRFFWPVAYALLIGCFAVLARHPRRRTGAALALSLGALQFLDAAPLRTELHGWATARQPWTVPAPALRELFGNYARLTLVPAWFCASGPEREWLMELLTLASERPIPVNTMYVARWRRPPSCEDPAVLAEPPAQGELRLFSAEAWARYRTPPAGPPAAPSSAVLLVAGASARAVQPAAVFVETRIASRP